jgi:hypothetical protein
MGNSSPEIVDIAQAIGQDPFMFLSSDPLAAHIDLLASAKGKQFGTILADPPWQFQNRTGKVAPEHKRLNTGGYLRVAGGRYRRRSGASLSLGA